MKYDKGCRVTRGECRDGFQHTVFRPGRLGRVSGQKVIAGLFRSELGDRRKNTIGIAGQHDNVARLLVYHARYSRVGDKVDRVCTARIFGNVHVVIIRSARNRVVDDVFQDGTETNGTKDFRFLFGGQVDALGVASSFNVEHARI